MKLIKTIFLCFITLSLVTGCSNQKQEDTKTKDQTPKQNTEQTSDINSETKKADVKENSSSQQQETKTEPTEKNENPSESKTSESNLEQQLMMMKEGAALIKGNDCLTCHKVDQKLVGPAYQEVAKKYFSEFQNETGIIQTLAEKVIKGGNKNWGLAMMVPHPNLSEDDAKKMVVYILSLADEKAQAEKQKRKAEGTW